MADKLFFEGCACCVYLAYFSRLKATDAAGCVDPIKDAVILDTLKLVADTRIRVMMDSPVRCFCLSGVTSEMKGGNIPERFTRAVIYILRKNKDGGNAIYKFPALKNFEDFDHGLCCPVKSDWPVVDVRYQGKTIQDNIHLVRLIVEEINTEAALNIVNQSKSFNRVGLRIVRTVLKSAGIELYFRSCIRIFYRSLSAVVEVNGIKSKTFMFNSSGLPAFSDTLYS